MKRILFGLAIGLSACSSLEQNIDLDLPQVPRELVVECYLEPGQPYRVLLTETKGYFDDLNECPMVRGATVIIRHAGRADTLQEAPYIGDCTLQNPNFVPFFNDFRTRFYNYGSSTICPLSYDQDFSLEIIDHQGNRRATATTRMRPPLELDSLTATFNAAGNKAFAFIKTKTDDPQTADYYRIVLHKGRLYKEEGFFNTAKRPEFISLISDANFFNGKTIAWGTGFEYEEGDTLIATLYRVEEGYYTYLRLMRNSENVGPFSQPPVIRSNVSGAFGIFTHLSYDRDTLIVRR